VCKLTSKIQKIMNDFERESSTMDMKEEMMSDAVDDAMEGEDEGEGEEVEGDKILKEVFDEIGMSMNDAVRGLSLVSCPPALRNARPTVPPFELGQALFLRLPLTSSSDQRPRRISLLARQLLPPESQSPRVSHLPPRLLPPAEDP
jgi:hypothetical protein